MTKNKITSNQWFIGITCSIIASIIFELFTSIKVLSGLLWVVKKIGSFLFTKNEWSNIGIIIIALLIPVSIIIITLLKSRFKSGSKETQEEKLPLWIEYNDDFFEGVRYRWRYNEYYGEYRINNILPYCIECDCQLVYDNCPNCKKNYFRKIKEDYEVEVLIHHQINTEKYKDKFLFKGLQ